MDEQWINGADTHNKHNNQDLFWKTKKVEKKSAVIFGTSKCLSVSTILTFVSVAISCQLFEISLLSHMR